MFAMNRSPFLPKPGVAEPPRLDTGSDPDASGLRLPKPTVSHATMRHRDTRRVRAVPGARPDVDGETGNGNPQVLC